MVIRRWAAFGLDYVLIVAYLGMLAAASLPAGSSARALFSTPGRAETAGFLLLTLPVVLYFTLLEGGSTGATWGKRRLRLRVVGPGGKRAGYGRALVRSAVKFLPWEVAHASIWRMVLPSHVAPVTAEVGAIAAMVLAVVWVLSPWLDARRRAVYDQLAGTCVAAAA